MKGFLLAILLFSMVSYAKDMKIENIDPNVSIPMKVRTLKILMTTVESQQDTISDLQWKIMKMQKQINNLRSKCTF